MSNLHALKRVARPEELARSVLYVASDDSSFVTGTASLSMAASQSPGAEPTSLNTQVLSPATQFTRWRKSRSAEERLCAMRARSK
jgi:5-deoxy-D-glucuronate isomerase